MNPLLIITILDNLMLLVRHMPRMLAQIQAMKEEINRMAREGRDPSDEEWEAVDRSIEGKLEQLRRRRS